jgi:RHO1 GDP-GTP exchange protein 1/2
MTVSPAVVPNLFDSARGSNTSLHVLREKCDASKILGLIRYKRNEFLVVYDGQHISICPNFHLFIIYYSEFGCYIDNLGIPVRSGGYISWECRATTYAHRGAHLLLFSPKFIEVRSIASGKLVQVIEGEDVRLVHSGLTEEDMLVAAMKGDIEDENGLSEKVLELVPTAAIDELVGRVEQYWDEWDV